jgi:hypothetical protein
MNASKISRKSRRTNMDQIETFMGFVVPEITITPELMCETARVQGWCPKSVCDKCLFAETTQADDAFKQWLEERKNGR